MEADPFVRDRGPKWRDPQHVAVSVTLVVVGLLMTSAPVVEAVLEMDEAPIFTFAERRVGDQGTYHWWGTQPGTEVHLAPAQARWHVMAWRWAEPTFAPRGLDRYGAVNVLDVDVEAPPENLAGRIYFEPGSFDPLGFERIDVPAGPFPPFEEFPPPTIGPLAWKGLFFFPSARENDWGCVHSLPTEGLRIFPSTTELRLPTMCFAHASYGWDGEIRFVLDRVEDSPEGRRLHAHIEHPDMLVAWTRYTFIEGVPEPAEIHADWGDGRSTSIVLGGFRRGDGPPLSRDNDVRAGAWESVPAFGDSAIWPISDGGSPMDVPFATAFSAAAAHPSCGDELADFLATHPTAFVFMAQSSSHIRDDGSSRRAWWFRVGDSSEARDFEVSRRADALADAPAECTWQAVAYDAHQVRPGADHDWSPGWPTVRSLLQNYAALAPDAPPPRDVGWQIGCFGPCGPSVRDFRQVRAGTVDYLYTMDGGVRGGPAMIVTEAVSATTLTSPQAMSMRLLAWYNEEQTGLLNRAHVVPADRAHEIVGPPPPDKAPAGASSLAPGVVAFDWSGARVAWYVTLLGGLVGVLYYLVPVLRDGASVGLFSRVQDEDLLQNTTRRRIHAAIEAEPGIHLRGLARRLGIGVTTLRHHLDRLSKAGIVCIQQEGRYRCYFLRGTDGNGTPVKSETASRLLGLIAATPGISQSAAAKELGVDRATVSRHVARLLEGERISIERKGRAILLHPVDRSP